MFDDVLVPWEEAEEQCLHRECLEVDQVRRREKFFPKRPVFPTSIVTNANLNSPRARPNKPQGRPIPSVFLTEDPVRSSSLLCSFSIDAAG